MGVTERQVLELTGLLRSAETERDELRAEVVELRRREQAELRAVEQIYAIAGELVVLRRTELPAAA